MRAAGIAILVFVIAVGAFGVSSAQDAERMSRVSGLVVDVNGSRVVGATIKIENDQSKRMVKSDDEGKFEVELAAGTYEVTVEMAGFRKFYLPNFRVGVATCELVNIHLDVAPPKLPLKVDSAASDTPVD